MSGTITRAAYQQLVDEDICWLERQPRTLERDHVIDIVRHSVEVYYGELRDLRDQVAQLTLERDREAALADHQAKGVETFSNQIAAANSEVDRLQVLRAQVAQLTNDVEKWSGLYSRLQDERAADFAKWFKIINFGGLTEYQAECPQVIDDALRQLESWRWTARMGLVVQAMASECAGKPDWAVLDVDGDMLGFGSTPMDAIKAAKKEVEGE